ncbi:RND family efflux transporter MFP subunit [Chitinophaga skermanii]|uniref:RND family efflux transporter MFP subunit n=1 Tax=Chitinophaga skermanii TaxID=331697 RepID=A0A327Q0M3_9BACT|nr:efflux RND transporter periplasmic adaptor subunit [Chitinophaga skermanii]RAI97444.1 RND family efflux transporter MFP subunit [Chitinophaga skermanii]
MKLSASTYMQHISRNALLLAGLGLTISFGACNTSKGNDEKSGEENLAVQVNTVKLEKGQLQSVLNLPGEIKSFQFVDLYAKVNSYVKTVPVDMGSEVKAGQVILTLEAPEMQSQLLEAQSRLKTKEAVLRASKATYDRLLKTSKVPGTISPNDLDMAFAKMGADSAELLAARSAYRGVADMLDYLTIRAPFSGVISQRNVHPGTYVGPAGRGSEKPLLRLEEQAKLRLSIAVPEKYVSQVQNAKDVEFTVRSLPGEVFSAHVARTAGSLDTKLRSELLEMDIINTDKKLLPGMYAEVRVPLPGKQEVFIVAKSAVITNSEEVFVIKVVNNKAVWVPVQKGNEADGKVEIFGALNPGDILITNATDEIKNGVAVQVAAAK